ncbi:MAG: xanthine dehydrogenase family protein subunit M [Rhodobacteraceae bacterium]|nr:xanthine dehydrogenase family protein subunit M [Paracoccaceae bacterium]
MGYFAPESLVDALTAAADGAKIVGGCTDFYPALAPGKMPTDIVDITRVREMRQIAKCGDGWRIGAAVTWAEIAAYPMPAYLSCLQQAAVTVGSVQIQNSATIGGNICNASPAADGIPPLLVLDAKLEIQSQSANRTIPLAEFITGARRVDLSQGELLTAIVIPKVMLPSGSSFVKLGNRKFLVISIAMASALVVVRDHRLDDVRIAVGSCAPTAVRLPLLEQKLCGLSVNAVARCRILSAHLAALTPISDMRGTVEYRVMAAGELCRRAIIEAMPDG